MLPQNSVLWLLGRGVPSFLSRSTVSQAGWPPGHAYIFSYSCSWIWILFPSVQAYSIIKLQFSHDSLLFWERRLNVFHVGSQWLMQKEFCQIKPVPYSPGELVICMWHPGDGLVLTRWPYLWQGWDCRGMVFPSVNFFFTLLWVCNFTSITTRAYTNGRCARGQDQSSELCTQSMEAKYRLNSDRNRLPQRMN